MIATPDLEADRFTAGLSVMAVLSPDEVIELLDHRVAALTELIDAVRGELAAMVGVLPRPFLIETEYGIAMLEAESGWARSLRGELAEGTFPDLEFWRQMHAQGLDPAEVAKLMEGGTGKD